MNAIHLIGRLTKDPDMRYLPGTETASTNFQIAVRRNFKIEKVIMTQILYRYKY